MHSAAQPSEDGMEEAVFAFPVQSEEIHGLLGLSPCSTQCMLVRGWQPPPTPKLPRRHTVESDQRLQWPGRDFPVGNAPLHRGRSPLL